MCTKTSLKDIILKFIHGVDGQKINSKRVERKKHGGAEQFFLWKFHGLGAINFSEKACKSFIPNTNFIASLK